MCHLPEQRPIYADGNKPLVYTRRVNAGNNRLLDNNQLSALPAGLFDGMGALEKL